jgi:hypothetical protein
VLVVGLSLLAGCANAPAETGTSAPADAQHDAVFSYDTAAFSQAKPWTSENFRNDPANFQFAIIGDRTGGANVQKTFEMAVGQLNLLQPEFVINVGDVIEGYSDEAAELNAEWDEMDGMMSKLQMPFFRTPGNFDIDVVMRIYAPDLERLAAWTAPRRKS